MYLSRRNFKQTGVMVALLKDGTKKEFPLYDTNLLREVDDMLEYIEDIEEVLEVIEAVDLYRKRETTEFLSEKVMDKIRGGLNYARIKTDKSIYG